MRVFWATAAILVLLALAWTAHVLWPRQLSFSPLAQMPVWRFVGGHQTVSLPVGSLTATVFRAGDELFAYLMFDYMRSSAALQNSEVLLSYRETGTQPVYTIVIHLRDDLLWAVPFLAQIQASGLIPWFVWGPQDQQSMINMRRQTDVFVAAYNLPVRRKLEQVGYGKLQPYLRRFIRFKALTDARVQSKSNRLPVLTDSEAGRLAADILAVADFYSLPLDFFLGIGAMENNYMNVMGDLEHTIWKRHAKNGDVVLKRRRGRVLVLNQSSGIWQITRETLRYAHRLFLKDQRDYSRLPERLRPSKDLDLDKIDQEVLTTYAGLLFRNLLDRFDGDVAKGVAAYNGGPGNPNMRYEAGVSLVAGYARKILEQAAALHGHSVADMSFIAPVPDASGARQSRSPIQ